MFKDITRSPLEMTNDIAFDLGAFNYPSFCDLAVWDTTKGSFEYVDFFEWHNGSETTLYGYLRGDSFETIEHKLHYIRGRLSSYSVGIEEDKIEVHYANSVYSRDRFVMWAKELITAKFGRSKEWKIIIFDGGPTIPNTPGLILEADRDIIKYFVGDKNE